MIMQNIYPWQQDQWSHCNALLTQGRFPHALLLEGSKHLGKRVFALALAKHLLCANSVVAFGKMLVEACGDCQSCCLVQSGNHPDLYVMEPLEKSKVIKIEQVRALVETLSQTSQQGGWKVAILYPAEAMNIAAANALLKTLEEPQNNIVFLLVSHQPSQIPATLRSRCQRMHFAVPKRAVSIDWLKENNALLAEEGAHKAIGLLGLAENIPLTALALMEDNRLAIHCTIISHFLDVYLSNLSPSQAAAALYALNLKERVDSTARTSKTMSILDISPAYVFNALWAVTMEMIRLKSGSGESPMLHDDYAEKFGEVSRKINVRKLFNFADELIVFKNKIDSKIALNSQLLLEDLLIKWA
jgi:DNA polymerase-3 subunit delta'